MAGESDWWKTTVDPSTGQYFTDYDSANAWAKGQGQKAANTAFNTTGATSGWYGTGIDWSTTGYVPHATPGRMGSGTWDGINYFGYYDPKTRGSYNQPAFGDWVNQGDITFSFGKASGNVSSDNALPYYAAAIDPHTGKITVQGGAGGGWYDPYQDYGLGADMIGLMPVNRNDAGEVTYVYAPTLGGGGRVYSVDEFGEAKAAVAAVRAERERKSGGGSGGGGSVVKDTGPLANPGAAEERYDIDKGFYDAPTNAQTAYDEITGKPTATGGLWDGYKDKYGQPGTEESELYKQYEAMFSDPEYLYGMYQRQADASKTALERRAASGGYGGSGAAARATMDVDRVFADRATAAMRDWATTGMGLAGAADTSENAKAGTALGLASGADAAEVARINAAGGVDAANVAHKSGGQAAASAAQTAENTRLTGSLTSATTIANDAAQLSFAFSSAADSQQFATDMAAIMAQVQSGQLTVQQAYTQATEMAATMGVANKAALDYYLWNKLSKK